LLFKFNWYRYAVVVDFCCGGAHQSLPLAFRFPDATFILLDAKRRSLDVAEERIKAGLVQVEVSRPVARKRPVTTIEPIKCVCV
jgi:methylase of polypeptide subunit release factors